MLRGEILLKATVTNRRWRGGAQQGTFTPCLQQLAPGWHRYRVPTGFKISQRFAEALVPVEQLWEERSVCAVVQKRWLW